MFEFLVLAVLVFLKIAFVVLGRPFYRRVYFARAAS